MMDVAETDVIQLPLGKTEYSTAPKQNNNGR